MAIPDYQTVMLPLLRFVARVGSETGTSDAVAALAIEFGLTPDELAELLPSGTVTKFRSRVGWGATYLRKAGLLEATRRGHFRITAAGQDLLKRNPPVIDNRLLMQYPGFPEFLHPKSAPRGQVDSEEQKDRVLRTPLEALEAGYESLRAELAEELLGVVKKSTPAFFERLVVDLLVKMGYGGSRSDAGKAIGQSGDGGIDGIIKEDRLGLDAVYIQAKRWDNASVGGSVVMQFAGALQRRKASKGVFITTSTFTKDAAECAREMGSRIVLIDGEELTNLMIEHGVGVSTVSEYVVKKVDADYFDDGE